MESPVRSMLSGRSPAVLAGRSLAGLSVTGTGLMRVGGLGAVLWVAARQVGPGWHGAHLAAALLMVGAGAGWIGWLAARHNATEAAPALPAPPLLSWLGGALPAGLGRPISWAALAAMAAFGGSLAALAPIALTFPAVAGLGAGIAFEVGPAAAVALIGAGSLVVAGAAADQSAAFVIQGVLAVSAGLMAGASRRQYTRRAVEAEALLAERLRADVEEARAAALEERNRIGREIHDVLAHSLGALAVQLAAADALLDGRGHTDGDADGDTDADTDQVRHLLRQARGLAVRGLDETRQAVRALRDEPVALAEQLQALVTDDGAELVVEGTPRPLPADAGVALYRAAQEAITNARKHAPGAGVSVHLAFSPDSIRLTVDNDGVTDTAHPAAATAADVAALGGGYGLQGMRERVELLGGRMTAGPSARGWTVEAVVPA